MLESAHGINILDPFQGHVTARRSAATSAANSRLLRLVGLQRTDLSFSKLHLFPSEKVKIGRNRQLK